MTFGAELVERGVDVDRVPEHDQIDDEPKRAELIFLPFAVTLTKLTALAVEYGAGELVTALAPVELDQDASPVGFVIDEPQHVERQIGRGSCRERVCQYVELSVVAVSLKKT